MVRQRPIVAYGNIQPSLVRKKDGTLVAYIREMVRRQSGSIAAFSKGDDMTWTHAEDTELPNPGTSVEAIALHDGQ